jgi:replicative DNA helicase
VSVENVPQNTKVEAGLLGLCLIEPDAIDDAAMVVCPDDFFAQPHALIADALFTLRNQGRPTDSLAVSAELTRRGDYGKAGGDEALVDLLKVAALSVDATHYAQIIRQYAIRRALIVAAHEIIADCYNLDLTAEEVVNRAEARLFAIGERGVGVKVLARIESEADDVIARAARRRAGEFAGVPTGIDGLDDITDGLQPGNLVILAARPSIGKTALALAVAWNAARRAGIGSAVFSLEMSNLDLCERLVVMASGVDGHKIRTGSYLTASEEQAIAQAASEVRDCETLWFTDAAMIGPEQVLSQCRRLKRRRGLGLVVVDYMQLMTPPADVAKRASRQEQVSALSRRLKLVAGELGVPVLVLSQLNRLAEGRADKRPMLSDLRESGAIEQDADVVLLLHRPEFYDATDRPGEAELIVAKNRNGRTGTIRLAYRKACAAFENHVPNFGPPPTGEPY